MARTDHTVVFCYDIVEAKARRRVAAFLEDRLVRVQQSVFEGRLPPERAHRLFDAVCAMLAPGDSLTLYIMTRDGLAKSRAHGGAPLPENESYYLL